MADGLLNKASIILTPTGYKAGTLYNVAPVVEPYEDFDFARASVASRVNSSGLVEMVGRTLGSELMPSVATIVNLLGGSITQISSNSYSSTSDGTTGSSLRPKFDFNTTSGKTYKLVITPTGAITGTLNFDFYDGSSYLFQNYDFTTTKEIYFTDNGSVFGGFDGTKTYSIASFTISVKEIIDTNNIPRISYDSNGDNGHILLEPTSTNLITYSEDFSQSIYIKDSTVSVGTINNVSPSGESNATKIDVTASGRIYANFTTDTYVSSIFIKAGTFAYFKLAGVQVDLVAVTNANGTIESLGNGWFKVSVNYTGARPFQIQAYPDGSYATHTTSGNYFIWGAQLETLSHPTSYIPTNGGTVTRATETATGAGSADLINSTEGVLYAEIAALADDSGIKVIDINDATSSNRVLIYYRNSTLRAFVIVNGTTVFSHNQSIADVTQLHKCALKWKQNDFAFWIDGVEVDTDNVGNTFGANVLNILNFADPFGSLPFYGKCKALAVFNEALSDDELNNLTG